MIAVWTVTGKPMQVGEAILDPRVPTLFEELPDEVSFQAVNLRTEEVDGPDAPTIAGGSWRDAQGETHGQDADPAQEPGGGLDDADVQAHLAFKGQVAVPQDELRELLARPTSEKHEAAVEEGHRLTAQVAEMEGRLRASSDLAKEADAAHKRASAEQRQAHKAEADEIRERAKADHDALVAKHKAETDRLKAELAEAKKAK